MAPGLLAIGASPRAGSNSDIVLAEALKAAEAAGADCTTLFLRDYEFADCIECNGCQKTGRCVVDDRMQELFPLVAGAELLVIATPVFFMNIPGTFKCFIDRFQCYWARRYALKLPPPEPRKKGVLFCTGGMDRPQQLDLIRPSIKAWFHVINAKYIDGAFFGPVDEKGAIHTHPDHLARVRELTAALFRQS